MENGCILLCAPSNVAVDQLLFRILELTRRENFDAVKIARWGRDDKIDVKLKHLKPTGKEAFEQLLSADILACTLNVCGNGMMTKVGALKKVDCLIIDEASQGSELDTIIPFVNFDVKKVILVGDHLQMSPTVFSEFSRLNMYEQSLFERIHHSFQKQGR